jgi:alpha/beta superfamily hydrolase
VAEIGPNSVLPARREPITLQTADGLKLVGEIALPENGEPSALLITVHPLPTHGGSMQSHLFRKMAWRLPALASIAVLRFNTRGTTSPDGTSEGSFDNGYLEGNDLNAAIDWAASRALPDPWLVGWSFGTDVILRHGDRQPVRGAILLSPPLRTITDAELAEWSDSNRPVIALIPEHDEFLPPKEARDRFKRLTQAKVIAVAGAKHLWTGEPYVRQVLNQIVQVVAPNRAPLPNTWDGPMTKWSDL